jgi:hypothetical protein
MTDLVTLMGKIIGTQASILVPGVDGMVRIADVEEPFLKILF